MVDQVEHENAVLRHDADADDGAEERNDVQGRTCEPKRHDGTEERKHGPKHDGDRLAKGTELDEQYGKDQQDGHDQHQQQIAKGLLLLLIETAVLDHSGRERGVGSELVPNLRNGAAQVAIFETRFDSYVLPQVLAVQFELARRFGNVRNLRELYQAALAGAQRQFAE